MLIRAYRVRGHLLADLDPLGLARNKHHPELDPKAYGFTEADLDREFFLDNVLGLEKATLRRIVEILQQTYSARIGVEFMHIQDPDQKAWIQARMEGSHNLWRPSAEEKRELLEQLVEAEGLRALPARQVPRHQALRPGWRRKHGAGARGDHPHIRRDRGGRDRHRHAPSRPPERAGQRDGQALPGDLLRVPGRRRRPTTFSARATSSTTSAPRPTASCRTAARCISA